MEHRPSGTVTFLFTDVEGSTRLWDEHPQQMRDALALHDETLRRILGEHRGLVFATGGDGVAVAFHRTRDALDATAAAQAALRDAPWPEGVELRVRMGIHLGEVDERDGDYLGAPVNRAARIMDAAHGGQVVVSSAIVQVAPDDRFRSLGHHRLRGFSSPDELWQFGPGTFPPLRSTRQEGNLPEPTSAFIGREVELAELGALVSERRMVTLVGVGGVGKTRLAIEAARRAGVELPDGAWFVDLSTRRSPEGVVEATLAAVGAVPEAGSPALESLLGYLAPRRSLVVLDNCEHLLDATASLASAVLARAPEVTLVATSREPLGVPGEQVWVVPTMAEAMELFVDRARLVDATYAPAAADLQVVASICDRLDEIPLAIELAAARTRSMTVSEIRDGLHDRFRLLRTSGRGGVERHQTLQAAVQWSCDLLDQSDQRLFEALSVFPADFDATSATAVCGGVLDLDPWELRDALDRLVERSLLGARTDGEVTRFRLLETFRQFGEQRLDPSRALALRRAHLAHFIELALEVGQGFWRRSDPEDARRWAADRDNIVAAMHWALTEEDLAACGALVAASLDPATWSMDREIHDWVLRAASHPDAGVVTLLGGSNVAGTLGGGDAATSLELARRARALDPDGPLGWSALASAYYLTEGHDTEWAEAAREVAERAADEDVEFRVFAYGMRATALAEVDRAESARMLEALRSELARAPSSMLEAFADNLQAECALRAGEPLVALDHTDRCLLRPWAESRNIVTVGALRLRADAMCRIRDADHAPAIVEACEALHDVGWWSDLWRLLVSLGGMWNATGAPTPAAVVAGCAAAHEVEALGLVELIEATATPTLAPAVERGRRMSRTELLEAVLAELAPVAAGGRMAT